MQGASEADNQRSYENQSHSCLPEVNSPRCLDSNDTRELMSRNGTEWWDSTVKFIHVNALHKKVIPILYYF